MATERKRLVGDRFRRIWSLVEEIAANPGLRRHELADRFHLSERQVQADLNIIREDMRMPLVRDGGYRFAAEGWVANGPRSLTLRDGLVALDALGKALPHYRNGPVANVIAKLPYVFPPHVQPLMRMLTGDVLLEPERRSCVRPIVTAAVKGRAVCLHYAVGTAPGTGKRERVVRPELLMPYLGEWYVLGEAEHSRTAMLPLAGVRAVTYAAEGARA